MGRGRGGGLEAFAVRSLMKRPRTINRKLNRRVRAGEYCSLVHSRCFGVGTTRGNREVAVWGRLSFVTCFSCVGWLLKHHGTKYQV